MAQKPEPPCDPEKPAEDIARIVATQNPGPEILVEVHKGPHDPELARVFAERNRSLLARVRTTAQAQVLAPRERLERAKFEAAIAEFAEALKPLPTTKAKNAPDR